MSNTNQHREWTSFGSRWSTGHGLAGSLICAVLLLAGILALAEPSEQAKPNSVVETKPLRPAVFVPRVVPEREVPDVVPLRDAIARTQFKGFFDSALGGKIPPPKVEALWETVTQKHAPDFDLLARAIVKDTNDEPQQALTPLAFLGGAVILDIPSDHPELLIPPLRAKMLETMVNLAREDRYKVIEKELIQQAEVVQKQYIEKCRSELEVKIGHAIGNRLNQMRDQDGAARLKNIEVSIIAIDQMILVVRDTPKNWDRLEATIKDAADQLEKARAKKDVPGANRITAAIGAHRGTITTTTGSLVKTRYTLRETFPRLEDAPNLKAMVVEAESLGKLATVTSEECLAALAKIDYGDARQLAIKCATQMREAHKQCEVARAILSLELTRQQSDRLAEQIVGLARTAEQIKEPETKGVRFVNESVRDTGLLLPIIERIDKQYAATRQTSKGEDKEWQQATDRISDFRKLFTDARTQLTAKQTEKGAEQLRLAAAKLASVDADLYTLQKKLGGAPADNPSTLARRSIANLAKEGKLVESLKTRFEKNFIELRRSEMPKRYADAVNKRLVSFGINDPILIARIHTAYKEILGTEILKQVKADEAITKGILSRLPAEPNPEAGPAKIDVKAAGGAQEAYAQHSDLIHDLIQYHVNDINFWKYPTLTPVQVKMADIELQLTTVQNRILAGDHDSLGQVDAGALVAVRRMVLNQSKSAGTRNRTPAMLLARSASPQALPGVRNLPVNEKSRRFAAIPLREPDAITIDGKLDDWKGVPVIELESFQKTKTKIPNHAERERAWAAYTREGLLIAVDVIDTSGKLEKNIPLGNFALNDAVEVLIDSLNTKLPKRGEPHVQHFFAFPFGHTTDEKSGGHESIIPEKGPSKTVAHPPQLFKRAAQKTERGWSMEMLIPNELLHGGGITPGRTIGFNLQLDTGTDMYWYFAAEKKLFMNQRPDTWGDLLPLGADATIELLDTDGNAINSIVAGRPFRLRIKDPDAKLGSQGPANLAVTLRTASGRRELISLEEMDVGTGIFEASIRTRLTTGDSSLGILELFEGDELAIEYVDRLRAFGERDVILSAKFHVASFGTKQRK